MLKTCKINKLERSLQDIRDYRSKYKDVFNDKIKYKLHDVAYLISKEIKNNKE